MAVAVRHVRAVVLLSLLASLLVAPAPPAAAAYPGANGAIAFERGYDIHLIDPDGSGLRNLTATPDVEELDPVISPDGTRVAFRVGTFGGEIWVQHIDGTGRAVVAASTADSILGIAERPTWSPDGTQIAFSGFHRTEQQNVLWVVDADGSGLRAVTTGYVAEQPSWGAHGEIAIIAPPARMLAVDPSTGAERIITRAEDAPDGYGSVDSPEWSPDGRDLVFSCDDDICEVPAEGGEWRYLTDPDSYSHTALRPQYSPDGQQVAWYGTAPDSGSELKIWRMPAAGLGGGAAAAVTTGVATDRFPDWGPLPGGATPPPPPGPSEPPGPPPAELFDEDPATTVTIDRAEPVGAAIDISRARFAGGAFAQGGGRARWVVLSRDDAFPDSLAGSALTSAGPMLFTDSTTLTPATGQEIARVLPAGGRVYLLGGTGAISQAIEDQLRGQGHDVRRLQGPSRVETALVVSDEVRAQLTGNDVVLLARAAGPEGNPTAGWADSVSGGGVAAYGGIPILVTQSEGMHPAVAAWLAADQPSQTILLGGTAALSAAVEGAAPNAVRVAGDDRTATAAAIAAQLWSGGGARRYVVVNGFQPQGWAFGLAAAGIAADAEAPVVLVGDQVSPATAGVVSACGAPAVDLVLVGDGSVIPGPVAAELDRLDGEGCEAGPGPGSGGTPPPPPPGGGASGQAGRWEVEPAIGVYELSFDYDGSVISGVEGYVAEECTGSSSSSTATFLIEPDIPVSGGSWDYAVEYVYEEDYTVREEFRGSFTSATTAEGELHQSFTGLGSTCTTYVVRWTATLTG